MHLTIDFETRSYADLKAFGPWKYAADPTTEIMCLAVKVDAQAPFLWLPENWRNRLSWPARPLADQEVIGLVRTADTVEAHNAEFEMAVWHHVLHKRHGWPDLDLGKMRCSAARASMCGLPRSLGQAAAVLGLPVQKDTDGHAVMMKMSQPTAIRRKVLGEWIVNHRWHEDLGDFEKLCRYCMRDVDTEYALSRALPPLPPVELEVWKLDQRMNKHGVRVDVEACEAWMRAIAEAEPALLDEWRRLTNGAVDSPTQVIDAREYFKTEFSVDMPDFRKDTIVDLLTELEGEAPL